MSILALERCPVCGGTDRGPVELGGAPEPRLTRCAACGCVHAREYADPDEVFREGYLAGGTGSFGIDLSHPRFHGYLLRTGERRMQVIERATGLRRGRLLDVGCGTGELVQAAGARGWDAAGAEPLPDASALARSRGVDVRTAMLADSGLPERSWDVVGAFHVLEHVPDTAAFLHELARWARPGGFVVVESPNWASVLRVRSGQHWMHLRPLEHLTHFTPPVLETALRRAGLEPVAVRTPSHLDGEQTLDEALDALGLRHVRGLRRALAPVARTATVEDWTGPVPSRPLWAALRAVERAYGAARRGMVVLGVARVP